MSCMVKSEASQMALVVKNLPANAGDTAEMGLIPGLGSSSGGANSNLLQHSMDWGTWKATVHGVAKSWT